MNKLIITLSALAVVAASASLVTADNSGGEVVPMLYLNVPIGGHSTAQREPEYGAALGIVETSRSAAEKTRVASMTDTGRPRLLDLRFKQGGVDSLMVNGVSLLQKIITVNADGSTSEIKTLADIPPSQWAILALGVGVTLCAGDVICDDDDPPPPLADVVLPDDVMADATF